MRHNLVIENLRANADAIRAHGVTALYLLRLDRLGGRRGRLQRDLRDYPAKLLGCKVDFTTRNALQPDLRDRITSSAIKVFGDAAVSFVAAAERYPARNRI
ncbi:MAG TPA: DNA polymerase III subunit beta [Xanthobacteraceae bacterium]|nr:DNA polymerase III subunit beta [Xanthobacteraceae bacterium]